ncbi:MAG: hypothetical protein K2V38_22325, partial [Gemmataceae bacterium]|nr:hypothetical protein [Gemmataceae bacterium]
ARDLAESHLDRALKGDLGPEKPAAQRLLGQLYLAARRADARALDEAEKLLVACRQTIPETHFDLIQLFAARGDRDNLRREADTALRLFREKAQFDPNNPTPRVNWSRAAAALEEFPEAVRILEEGFRATGDPLFRSALATVHAAWYDHERAKPTPAVPDTLGLLDAGLKYDAANRDLLNRLSARLQTGPEAAPARAALERLLAEGSTARAHIHFALAIDAQLRKDAAAEKVHLELAYKADKNVGVVANNLAVTLTQPPNQDLPRALELVNAALRQDPDSPTFRDTRGHVHLLSGRWAEAIDDFEFVLSRQRDAEGAHAALATAYENVGRRDLAAEHRRLADRPKPKPKTPTKP